ncbi:hypothetical protein QBL02_12610 [Leucobacter sp. UT-8R-CII-1-4]|uniref:hypothetical protein n=1 Tax=Leucobacter sp. UT-8R-CII-1-4 TaxID=3040075 RepID=UPI0024A7DE67|nr:hypothetical protein [Leucobacter sp. UT-8R-CII-1-4]MDI6024383.1 hypothetical protein [Leucobacter sp. UT-8R-CII-1-4]
MTRINGRKLGIWSLRIDAIYCLILGAFVAITAPQLSRVIALPMPLIAGTGLLVAIWAMLVWRMVQRMRIRLALQLVMGVNIVAALLIVAASLTSASTLVMFIVVAVAIDVALFAVSQAVAIRNIGPALLAR